MKIITFNIANYDDHGHWDERVEMIANILIDHDPTLIALQEIRFNPAQPSTTRTYQDMAQQVLAAIKRLGHPAWSDTTIITQPAMYYPNTWQYPELNPMQEWEGLSIMSRSPVLETGSRFLSPTSSHDPNRRITQYVTTDGQHFLFNAHFSYDQSIAHENARQTVAYMAGFGGQQLLVGDLNSQPTSPALNPIKDAGFVDLWQQLRGNDPGYTIPSSNPSQRIDYVWATPELAARATQIEVIGTEPEGELYASDHFGLCVTFE